MQLSFETHDFSMINWIFQRLLKLEAPSFPFSTHEPSWILIEMSNLFGRIICVTLISGSVTSYYSSKLSSECRTYILYCETCHNMQDSLSQPQPIHFYYVCLIYYTCVSCVVSLIKTIVYYCYWQSDWILLHSWNIDISYFGWGWTRELPEMSGSASAKAFMCILLEWNNIQPNCQ